MSSRNTDLPIQKRIPSQSNRHSITISSKNLSGTRQLMEIRMGIARLRNDNPAKGSDPDVDHVELKLVDNAGEDKSVTPVEFSKQRMNILYTLKKADQQPKVFFTLEVILRILM